jgi:hypothetical protein
METPSPATKNTAAFFAQSALAFGIALLTLLAAIYFLPADPWKEVA